MGAILKELHNSASKFQFPSMPKDDVDVKRETAYQEYNILGKGKMSYPSGMGTQIIKWSGYFWGSSRKKLASVNQKWIAPKTCISKLENWQTKKTPLNLVISEAGINKDVTIKTGMINHMSENGYTKLWAESLIWPLYILKNFHTRCLLIQLHGGLNIMRSSMDCP